MASTASTTAADEFLAHPTPLAAIEPPLISVGPFPGHCAGQRQTSHVSPQRVRAPWDQRGVQDATPAKSNRTDRNDRHPSAAGLFGFSTDCSGTCRQNEAARFRSSHQGTHQGTPLSAGPPTLPSFRLVRIPRAPRSLGTTDVGSVSGGRCHDLLAVAANAFSQRCGARSGFPKFWLNPQNGGLGRC